MSECIVFISYSHDSAGHRDWVLGLSERLREDGFETRLDRYVNGTPKEGWPRWMLNRLDEATHVLVVCTATYYRRFRGHEVPGLGKGVDWEGALITLEMYDERSSSTKFVPVLPTSGDAPFIPEPLRGATHYVLDSEERYKALLRFLAGADGIEPGPVGSRKVPPRATVPPISFSVSDRENASATSFPELSSTSMHPNTRLPAGKEHLRTPLIEERPMYFDQAKALRIQQLDEQYSLWQEKLHKLEIELPMAEGPDAQFSIEQNIKRKIYPQLSRINKEYGELLASGKLPLTEDEAETLVEDLREIVAQQSVNTHGLGQVPEKVDEIAKVLDEPEKLASAKLKLVLPLVPLLVNYEFEVDTNRLFSELWTRIRSLFSNRANPN